MLAFIVRRILQASLVMLVVGFVSFSLFQYVGDPVLAMLGQKVGAKLEPHQMEALKNGEGVDLSHLIHAVKHESLWIVGAILAVCVLYFVGMRLTESKKA